MGGNMRMLHRISSTDIVERQRMNIIVRLCALLLVATAPVLPPGAEAAEPYPDPASEMWLEVRQSTDPKLLEGFIKAFPESPYAHAARARLERVKTTPATADEDTDSDESFIITYPAQETAPTGAQGATAPPAGAATPAAVSAPTLPAPGSSFRDTLSGGGKGPVMVVIPAGRFMMGCVSGQNCYDREKPVHEVVIARPFAISKYEITFEDYDRFTYPNKVDDEGWGRGRRPIINVSWDDATEYAAWLSAQTGKRYRLPTEAEWEYAARAGSTTKYSWGNDIGHNRANCDNENCGDSYEYTAPVGSFPANAWGLHDMLGNVFEWVQDCWNGSYAGAPGDGNAWASGDCSQRVGRGGAWESPFPWLLRSAFRFRIDRANRFNFYGFRLAQDL